MQIPKIQPIQTLQLPEPLLHQGPWGIPIYELALGSQDLLRLELIFEAGRWSEHKPLAARALAKLIKSGIQGKSAKSLAEAFEFYGAKLHINEQFDSLSMEISCLKKHFPELLKLVFSVITEPLFPEKEFQQFAKRSKQQLKNKLSKNELQAYRRLTERLFGKEHPYGYNTELEHFDALSVEDVRAHHRRCINASGCKVLLAGKSDAACIALLQEQLARLAPPPTQLLELPQWPELPPLQRTVEHIPARSEKNMQASLRLGFRCPHRHSPDFASFSFLSTILGGHFGARLMQNLREDKGYTYSVYSSVEAMRHSSYFYISAEVALQSKEAALKEIYAEIERLQEEPISAEELHMNQQYLLGNYLNALDGPFAIASVWSELIRNDIDASYFQNILGAIRNAQATDLQALAQKYFKKEHITEIVVG